MLSDRDHSSIVHNYMFSYCRSVCCGQHSHAMYNDLVLHLELPLDEQLLSSCTMYCPLCMMLMAPF